MKTFGLTICAIFIALQSFAQPVSKKGEPYLPQEGDWAVAIDATPFLEYIGNFFSDANNTAPTAQFPNDQFAITAKLFKTDDFAYRASARVNVFLETNRAFVPEFSTTPTNTTVEDTYSRSFNNFTFGLGIEKRKGNTRIQGFYGVEGLLGLGLEKHTFDYGNNISPENTSPVRTEWPIEFQDDPREITTVTDEGAFITEFKKGTTFSLGARAFIGAEIFLFPKWSLGFELGVSMGYFYTGNSTIVAEQWTIPPGGNSEQFVTTVTDEGGDSVFQIDNDNSGGALFLSFYF